MDTLPVSSRSSQTLVQDCESLPSNLKRCMPFAQILPVFRISHRTGCTNQTPASLETSSTLPQPVTDKSSIYEGPTSNQSQPTVAIECLVEDGDEDGSESEYEHEHYQERHDDHWDEVVYWSPWTNWVHTGDGWPHNFMRSRELSKSNEDLLKDPDNQRWLRKLSQFQQKDLPSLKVWAKGNPRIPLFKDEASGDEYQIHLNLGLLTGLTRINCPKNMVPSPENPEPWKYRADPLYQVRYRLQTDDLHGSRRETAPIPKFIIPLGKLAVRTSLREPWQTLSTKDEPPPTELTDYLVVIDAGHEDLPVWILVSQSILRDRMEHEGRDYPQLPIFRGAMRDVQYGYDTACVFRSVRDLGGQGLGQRGFDEACKLVDSTRCKVDPGFMHVGEDKMAELSGKELSRDWSVMTPDEEISPGHVEDVS